jgi:hypothetical protein
MDLNNKFLSDYNMETTNNVQLATFTIISFQFDRVTYIYILELVKPNICMK